jgi:hypothetical protein
VKHSFSSFLESMLLHIKEIKMKESIYQGIIALLLVVVAVFGYKLYDSEGKEITHQEMASHNKQAVDVRALKPTYPKVEMATLLPQQKKSAEAVSEELTKKLALLERTMEQSQAMLEEYNEQNPHTPLTFENVEYADIQAKALQERPTMQKLQQKLAQLEEQLAHHQSDQSEPEQAPTPEDEPTKEERPHVALGGALSTPTQTTSSTSSTSTTTHVTPSPTVTTPQTVATAKPTADVDKELLTYQTSIQDVTNVIEQINQNLQ